jgi:hypothetical protein
MSAHTDTDIFLLGGDQPVRRIGYGTMQLAGRGHRDLPSGFVCEFRVLARIP